MLCFLHRCSPVPFPLTVEPCPADLTPLPPTHELMTPPFCVPGPLSSSLEEMHQLQLPWKNTGDPSEREREREREGGRRPSTKYLN